MLGIGLTDDETSSLIEDAYSLEQVDIRGKGNKALRLLFDGEDSDSAGPVTVYRGIPTLGRKYSGKNPRETISPGQDMTKFILYVIAMDGPSLVFKEKAVDFGFKPSLAQLQSKANEMLGEDIGSFDPADPLDLTWNGPCILGFVMVDKRCRFLKANGKANAIHCADGTDINRPGNTKRRSNKTFGNSVTLDLDNDLEMLIVENHHLYADNGKPRKDIGNNRKDDDYKMDLYVMVEFDEPSVRLPVIVDPSGRNTGP